MERVTYFGDAYIDSLISHKLYEAKEKGIDIEVSCNIISIGKINPPDLGILIANALDNAIIFTNIYFFIIREFNLTQRLSNT